MAIKEEQYDPGYEDAYGGAYAEKGPEGEPAPSQTNGHCTFSSVENRGKPHTQSCFRNLYSTLDILLKPCRLLKCTPIVLIRVKHDFFFLAKSYFDHCWA